MDETFTVNTSVVDSCADKQWKKIIQINRISHSHMHSLVPHTLAAWTSQQPDSQQEVTRSLHLIQEGSFKHTHPPKFSSSPCPMGGGVVQRGRSQTI
ncbi:hypothetical protein NQZ68_023276 [Dissostichus eleginoides]|nr:hypothetical protein NQZ68_023276 [Dissostichus eleginoides]